MAFTFNTWEQIHPEGKEYEVKDEIEYVDEVPNTLQVVFFVFHKLNELDVQQESLSEQANVKLKVFILENAYDRFHGRYQEMVIIVLNHILFLDGFEDQVDKWDDEAQNVNDEQKYVVVSGSPLIHIFDELLNDRAIPDLLEVIFDQCKNTVRKQVLSAVLMVLHVAI